MNNVFLIDGAAGTGKSDLINFVRENLKNYDINIIKKNTTRPKRKNEEAKNVGEELKFSTSEEFEQNKLNDPEKYYTYQYGGHDYSFSKEELKESVKRHKFTFVIVRDRKLISNIKNDLANTAFTFHLYLYTDEELLRKRLKVEGFSDKDIEKRIERNRYALYDYFDIKNKKEVIVLINTSNKAELYKQLRSLVEDYENYIKEEKEMIEQNKNVLELAKNVYVTLPDSLVGYKDKMVQVLQENPYEKNIFIMMKFRNNNLKCYRSIESFLNNSGYNCVRADLSPWNHLTGETHNFMAVAFCCKYGIALFDKPETRTDKNDRTKKYRIDYSPNVAYELGLMQSHNRDCLILKHDSLPDAPFDLVKDYLTPYKEDVELITLIQDWLENISPKSQK